jgi:hypothetical protein
MDGRGEPDAPDGVAVHPQLECDRRGDVGDPPLVAGRVGIPCLDGRPEGDDGRQQQRVRRQGGLPLLGDVGHDHADSDQLPFDRDRVQAGEPVEFVPSVPDGFDVVWQVQHGLTRLQDGPVEPFGPRPELGEIGEPLPDLLRDRDLHAAGEDGVGPHDSEVGVDEAESHRCRALERVQQLQGGRLLSGIGFTFAMRVP